jgi:hypothetical protein
MNGKTQIASRRPGPSARPRAERRASTPAPGRQAHPHTRAGNVSSPVPNKPNLEGLSIALTRCLEST